MVAATKSSHVIDDQGMVKLLVVPKETTTLDGFREWVLDDRFPEHQRTTFIRGEVSLEVGGDELLVVPASAHTYRGFLRWVMSPAVPEGLHVTFLQGDLVIDMTEESLQTHVAVKGAVYATLFPMVTEDDGEFYTHGVLITNEEADVSNNPDGVAVLPATLKSRRVRFLRRKGMEMAIEGSPDWIMEIVSESSVRKDTKELRTAYHKARIPEYWFIDARDDELSFQILHWRRKSYVAASVRDGWIESKVFGRLFKLTRRLTARGAWIYSLKVKRIPEN